MAVINMKRQNDRLNEPPFLPVRARAHTHTHTHAYKTNEGEMKNFLTAGLVLQDAQHRGNFFT